MAGRNPSPAVFGALPFRVKELVGDDEAVAHGGVDGKTGLCWLVSAGNFLVWRVDRGVRAHVTVLRLPPGAADGALLVEFVLQASGVVSALVVSASANRILIWPDATQPFQSLTQPLKGNGPTALTASSLSDENDTAQAVIAIVGFQDGAMQRVQTSGSSSAIHSRMLPTADSRKNRRGIIPMLSSAMKAAYAETFYPTAGKQALCSGDAVVSVRLLPRSGGDAETLGLRDLLVMTGDSVEQWKLLPWAAGEDHDERCEVSLRLAPMLKQPQLGLGLPRPLLLSMPKGSEGSAVVLAAGVRPGQSDESYALLRLRLSPGKAPSLEGACLLPGCPVPPASAQGHHQVLMTAAGPTLLREPAGGVWLIADAPSGAPGGGASGSGFAEAVRVPGGGVLGCSMSSDGAAWLLLDPYQGVLSIRVTLPRAAEAPQQQQQQQVQRRLGEALDRVDDTPIGDAALKQVYEELDSALALLASGRQPKALGYTLEKLGAFAADGKGNAVARYSSDLLDRLPKHWHRGAEAEAGLEAPASLSTGQQLEHKMAQHSALIDLLEEGGCLRSLRGGALRVIFENAEKCSALASVRTMDNRLPHRLSRQQVSVLSAYGESCGWSELGGRATRSSGAGAGGRAEAALAAGVKEDRVSSFLALRGEQPLHEAIEAAGAVIQATSPLFAQRDPWEVFYARPTSAVQLLFGSFAGVLQSGLRVTHQKACLAAVRQLLEAADVALLTASSVRDQLQRRFPREVALARGGGAARVPWAADRHGRNGLQALMECCLERRPPIAPPRCSEQVAEVKGLLFSVTDRLLTAYAQAEAAVKSGGGSADDAGEAAALDRLSHAYCDAKHRSLAALLEEGKWEAESQRVSYMDVGLMQGVERLAEAHASFPQLFDMSEATRDAPRLHQLMESCGPPGELTRYVLGRLHAEGRHAELLRLPGHFDAAVREFLEDSPELLWKHEVRMRRFGGGGASLLRLVGAREAVGTEEKRHLLSLEHLCHLATASPGLTGTLPPTETEAANQSYSELVLLDIQRLIGKEEGFAMKKGELVKAALTAGMQDPKGFAWAMTVFAVAGPEFMAQNREQMKGAWLEVVRATNWGEVLAARSRMADNQWLAALEGTPMVQAVRQAYFQYGLEAQIPAEILKEWLGEEPALGSKSREAALLAVEYAVLGGGATASMLEDDAAAIGEDEMEQ